MKLNLDLARTLRGEIRVPIATKLILSFLLIIAFISAVFIVAGIQLIGSRVVVRKLRSG